MWFHSLTHPQLGYKSTTAQLLSVPPYAAAAIFTIVIGFIADKTGQRGLCNIFCSLLGVVGFSMLLAGTNPRVQYAGTFLGALGIYPCIANTVSWVSNNTEGVYKRGVTLGIVIGWGNLNGVMSSNIYQKKDKPLYRTGHAVVLAYLLLFLTGGSTLLHLLLRRENAKRRRGERDYLAEGKTEDEVQALGDVRYVCPQLVPTRHCWLIGFGQAWVLLHHLRIGDARPHWLPCLIDAPRGLLKRF